MQLGNIDVYIFLPGYLSWTSEDIVNKTNTTKKNYQKLCVYTKTNTIQMFQIQI